MPPSERTQAQTGDQEDEILERKPSHPVTTTLLIVSAVALSIAIGITVTELERYVNRDTRSILSEYKTTAVQYHEQNYGTNQEQPEDEEAPRKRKPKAEAPAEAPASEAPASEAPASEAPASEAPAEKAPEAPAPAPEGAPTGESAGG